MSGLNKVFDTYKTKTTEATGSTGTTEYFCQQKYINYALTTEAKQQFITILDKAALSTTQNAVFESINRKNDTIL